MAFDSFAAFLAMGKHAVYVWSAYGLFAAVVALNVAMPVVSRRRYLREQGRRLRREANR